ncbi:thiamine ABC transporter ATP-binding protein [Nitratireductor basaltis]|uniref:Thiamine ABC transporter ATP-binding protein n=1 Tax=Nitratireductor basaltis TaxID=472175 RepID=A0A084U729_9HYPH|nr:thiamine ABC transporter ATP-binding protein [Nitratireductor basaltis]KFB08765.1 Thiamine ABC transporter ATP-binding protein [Nitratireductor basaltis]
MTAPATIELRDIRFSYPGGADMVFDLKIRAGEKVAVMGPSGSGKSTLLNLIAGFERPQEGSILIDGQDVTTLPPDKRPVSMVFQENNLFSHLSVRQNVGLGRSPSLRLNDCDRQAVESALMRTGLGDKADRLPAALSGGERQRVALARVLVRNRAVLLLDEPLASLGPALREEMLALIADLHLEGKMTIVMATHAPEDAGRLTDRLVHVAEGRIAGIGATKDYLGGQAPEGFRDYLGKNRA